MKIKIFLVMILIAGLTTPTALAKPERLEVKNPSRQAKEKAAKAQIKAIDLQDIEDPVARKAIREILNYLNLQAQQ